MITCIECPVCGSDLKLDVSVKMRAKLDITMPNGILEKRELMGINVKNIEPTKDRWLKIIEQIKPYLRPGLTTEDLTRILNDEYNICTVHTPLLIEKIKEAYDLYTKDGKTLEKI